jgi:D-alanyl-D-alanine carboxypeptidase
MSVGHAVAVVVTAVSLIGAAQPAGAAPRDPARQELNALVRDHGFAGALAAVRDRQGRSRDLTAGVGDRATGAPVPADGRVRIGSDTKASVAVVVLQLVAERKVQLDAPVQRYLPDGTRTGTRAR